MTTYNVKSNLKHDGKFYKKGDEVELDEKTARQLKSDNVVADLNSDVEDEERTTPQPGVNKVSRKNGETTGSQEVEAGKGDKPEETGEDVKTDDKKEDTGKTPFKVLKGLEFPKGTVYNVGDTIELTEEDAKKFKEGLIEPIADEDNL